MRTVYFDYNATTPLDAGLAYLIADIEKRGRI